MRTYFYSLVAVSFLIFGFSGCNPYNNAGEGAVTGGALGAMAGGIIGHQSHDTAAGMLIGGTIGAVTGAAVGSQVQKPVYVEPEPAPTVITQQAVPPSVTYAAETVTINIPSASGNYTAVVLKRSGSGYIGPQGEYYDQIPSTAQLQAMYGR